MIWLAKRGGLTMDVSSILKNDESSIAVHKGDKVSSLIGALEKKKSYFAYAKEDQAFLGAIDFNLMLKSRISIESIKVDSFIKPVSALNVDHTLEDAAIEMINSDSFVLPVFDNGAFLGVVDVLQVLEYTSSSSKLKNQKPNDTDISAYTVNYYGRAGTILSDMRHMKLWVVPVLSDSRLAGVVSVADLLSKYYRYHLGQDYGHKAKTKTRGFSAQKESVLEMPIGNFMSENYVFLKGQESLGELAKKFSKQKSLIAVKRDASWFGAGSIIQAMAGSVTEEPRKVFFSGLGSLKLPEREIQRLHEISESYIQRIQDLINNEFSIRIHVKATRKSGSQKLFELSLRLEYPGPPVSANTQEWDIKVALRLAYDQLLKQLEKYQKQYDVSGVPKESEVREGAAR